MTPLTDRQEEWFDEWCATDEGGKVQVLLFDLANHKTGQADVAKEIYALLASHSSSLVERVREMKPNTDKYFSFADGYKIAISDVLSLLKEEGK